MTTTENAATGRLDALSAARSLVDAAQGVVEAALRHGAELTGGGRDVDEHQVHVERLAYLATQVRAAHELAAYAQRLHAAGRPNALIESDALVYAAEAAHALRSSIGGGVGRLRHRRRGGGAAHAEGACSGARGARPAARARDRAHAAGSAGREHIELEDEVATLTRDTARAFARNEVAPRAQEIHRQDLLVPEELIAQFSAQGFFGSSIRGSTAAPAWATSR